MLRRTACAGFKATTPLHWLPGCHSHSTGEHKWIAYIDLHDLSLDNVSQPGTPNPRDRYIWRRVQTRLLGNERTWYRDNMYPEELPIVFRDAVPGGHGDRFTHSWLIQPRPNSWAHAAIKMWERDNLTPEQLAAKYGIYIPRQQKGSLIACNFGMCFVWWYLMMCFYNDDDTLLITHAAVDDFIREMGGVEPLSDDDMFLEQWYHPYIHRQRIRKMDAHWMYKPVMKDNVVDHATPYGAYIKAGRCMSRYHGDIINTPGSTFTSIRQSNRASSGYLLDTV